MEEKLVKLTEDQRALLRFLMRFHLQRGYYPTMAEIAQERAKEDPPKRASPQSWGSMFSRLVTKGLILKDSTIPRSYVISDDIQKYVDSEGHL